MAISKVHCFLFNALYFLEQACTLLSLVATGKCRLYVVVDKSVCVVYCFDTKKKQEKNNPWCELTNQILKDMFGLSHLSNTFDEALSNIVQKHSAKVRIPQLCVCTYGAWLRRNFPLNPRRPICTHFCFLTILFS